VGGVVYNVCGTSFPYGTLVINLLGCLLIGFLSTIAEQKFLFGSNVRVMLMIGFCGAFTTFSTLILETNSLMRDGEMMRAFLNVLVSVVAGFILFRIGVLAGEVI
jgi:CrcB protein